MTWNRHDSFVNTVIHLMEHPDQQRALRLEVAREVARRRIEEKVRDMEKADNHIRAIVREELNAIGYDTDERDLMRADWL